MLDLNLMSKNLDEMQILDKIIIVKSLVEKAKNDEDYGTKINLPEDFNEEGFYEHALNVVDSAEELLSPQGIDNLLDAEREESYATINYLLDYILLCFPEYAMQNTQVRGA